MSGSHHSNAGGLNHYVDPADAGEAGFSAHVEGDGVEYLMAGEELQKVVARKVPGMAKGGPVPPLVTQHIRSFVQFLVDHVLPAQPGRQVLDLGRLSFEVLPADGIRWPDRRDIVVVPAYTEGESETHLSERKEELLRVWKEGGLNGREEPWQIDSRSKKLTLMRQALTADPPPRDPAHYVQWTFVPVPSRRRDGTPTTPLDDKGLGSLFYHLTVVPHDTHWERTHRVTVEFRRGVNEVVRRAVDARTAPGGGLEPQAASWWDVRPSVFRPAR